MPVRKPGLMTPSGAAPGPRGGTLVAIFVGGAAGTVLRAGLAEGFAPPAGAWPWPTFVANVVACLLLGWIAVRFAAAGPGDPRLRPLLATGLCGGLSTFSTLQVELVHMVERDDWALAAGYAAASIAAGLAAVVLGRRAARTDVRSAA